MQESKLSGSAAKGALNPAEVAGKQEDWAKLPPAMRDELIQIPGADMPARWKLRSFTGTNTWSSRPTPQEPS